MSEKNNEAKSGRFWKLDIGELAPGGERPPFQTATNAALLARFSTIADARAEAKGISQAENCDVFVMQSVSVVRVQAPLPPPVSYERL